MQVKTTPATWRNDAPLARTCSTEQAADALHIKPQTLRAALCRDGHYFGIRPVKLPNRMLAWPCEAIARLTAGEVAQ
ncbi:MAG TPA: hypothetical protein PKW99_03530 [Thauera sp.]|nr:hypothetical protein [Thauera sp.]